MRYYGRTFWVHTLLKGNTPMIDGTYKIALRTPQGTNDGSAVISSSGDAITANFTIDGIGSLRQSGTHEGDEFFLSGSTNLYLVGRIAYQLNGLVAGNSLKVTCETDKGTFDIAGSRLA